MNTHFKSLLNSPIHEVGLFLYTFIARTAGYLLAIKQSISLFANVVFGMLFSMKRQVVRQLMRRRTEITASPRVTVATVSVGLCFSLVPLAPQADTFVQFVQDDVVFAQPKSTNTLAEMTVVATRSIGDTSGSLPAVSEIVTHTIESGDTLYGIADEYLVPVDAIAYVNNISVNDLLRPGDTLTIPPVEGLTHTVKEGESVASIADKYKVSPQGVVDANVLKPPFNLFAGTVLVIPGGEVPQPVKPAPVVLASANVEPVQTGGLSLQAVSGAAAGSYIIPTAGKITQYASYYHMAIDIAKGCGEPIWAASEGTVIVAGPRAGGYGITVWMQHPDGRVTQYAHMSRVATSVGQTVAQGEIIGYTGATGIAYGCHLHFVVQEAGRAVNPMSVL